MAHTAIVTGGLRGLGLAMTLGLLREGINVAAVGHIESDLSSLPTNPHLLPLIADIRSPAACDKIFSDTLTRFGTVDILVNNAGLTFTTIAPDRFRRDDVQTFWKCRDDIVQAVMDTNYVAADQMARRAAQHMVPRGWGRIVNVTTKLDTMNRAGSSPYGSSKAALELASEIWARDLEGTGVTCNIVNPGGGANTPGMAQEFKDAAAAGKFPIVQPEEMVPPLLFVVSRAADQINGFRFDANAWDISLPPEQAARAIARPAGFVLHPARPWD
jgi:3-oxoacyl-[acyl-carrier protein] reductase